MGTLSTSIPALLDALLPFLPAIRADRTDLPEWIGGLSTKLLPKLEADPAVKSALLELEENPGDEDMKGALRLALRKLFAKQPELDSEAARMLGPRNLPSPPALQGLDALDPSDPALRHLEMVRLLRLGVPAAEVARRFRVDPALVFHLNSAFAGQGVLGLAQGAPARRWFDQLRRDDPLLRRLEMVRLARSGVPLEVVGSEFGAAAEYVERLVAAFEQNGSAGLVGEAEVRRYEDLHPAAIRLATYNLHGVHDGEDGRYRLIARELAAFDPDLVGFQEVIDGAGIRETSAQLAEKMSAMAGADYRTTYTHCHLYMEKHPEGVAVATRHPLTGAADIDLNVGLSGGVKPSMPRFAAACQVEVRGRRIAFASTHLDHAADPAVRAAQAQKLVRELERLYPDAPLHVIAGDMNDVQGSPAITHFEEQGYVDAYRACHPKGGNTFTTTDPRTRIDFVLVKGAKEFVSASTALSHPSLSDHLGVFVSVR
ncbi:MAG TPA: endonuclease/exonuclease/phosphatase family protein [Myxococcales bacterium]|jgi:endonuclease/exonuclease/phosphatase family metal-dependent hydrolase